MSKVQKVKSSKSSNFLNVKRSNFQKFKSLKSQTVKCSNCQIFKRSKGHKVTSSKVQKVKRSAALPGSRVKRRPAVVGKGSRIGARVQEVPHHLKNKNNLIIKLYNNYRN